MTTDIVEIVSEDATQPMERDTDVKLGQWYWVTEKARWDGHGGAGTRKGDDFAPWLGCVMHIGSNYVKLESPKSERSGYHSKRIHFDNFFERTKFEPNADAVIKQKIAMYECETVRLMGEVAEITRRLGVAPTQAIAQAVEGGQNSLVVLSREPDVQGYEKALVEAKKKLLPDLYREIEQSNNQLATWMMAPSMPLRASIVPLHQTVEAIEDRVFSVSLYAGLTEKAHQCSDGEPAAMLDKLHVMQRRLYMDEECLLAYEAGGMEFRDISLFDAWIARPENRDRIFPFPRTLVAFRVRRVEKERNFGPSPMSAFINFQLGQGDKATFIYVRNGEQVWRISTEVDFGEMIFPDQSVYDPFEPKMMEIFAGGVKRFMPRREWEDRLAEEDEKSKLAEEWKAANPDMHSIHNPHNSHDWDRLREWEPFDPSSVFYDDGVATMSKEVKEYNRVALIIQGLFDRSPVLNPHPPVKTWVADGFERAIKLVYDANMVLTYNEAPDFKAYQDGLNASLNADSIVTGQDGFWEVAMAQRENERISNHRNSFSGYLRYRPYGNPGPGMVGKMAEWKPRVRQGVFRWMREKGWSGDQTSTSISVPAGALLNVSAYTPGDYKRFFHDPRTRADYLQWAPLMLAAEDYLAGKMSTPPNDSVFK